MKIKTLLLFGLCTISLFSWEVQAANTKMTIPIETKEITDPPSGYDKINLLGSLMYGIGPNAIIAGASDDAVYIGFNQDFGNVNINIYNGAGLVVYSTVVNTSVQQVVIIPITSAASGTYTVELSNANGYADGDFELN